MGEVGCRRGDLSRMICRCCCSAVEDVGAKEKIFSNPRHRIFDKEIFQFSRKIYCE